MSVEIVAVPKDVATLVNLLRNKLRQHGFAFGAVYCVKRGEGGGDVLLIDETMPQQMRVFMLHDLVRAAEQSIQRFQQ